MFPDDKPLVQNMDPQGTLFLSASQLAEMEEEAIEREIAEKTVEVIDEMATSNITSYIKKSFFRNRDERRDSGMEDKMFQAIRAYNGEYDPEELAKIKAGGGSEIYMNLTATKSRAAQSWIRDILLSATEAPFSLERTPIPSLPEKEIEKINSAFTRDFSNKAEEMKQQNGGQAPLEDAQNMILEESQKLRDIKEAILDEINLQASFELKMLELQIKDQLIEGDWQDALSTFIEDFCVFPTAFMKGPIITKTAKKLQWKNGVPEKSEEYYFFNKRVSPFDVYPSPESACVTDGDFIEHIRLSRNELEKLRLQGDKGGYSREKIEKVLDEGPDSSWIDTGIEDEINDVEKKGDPIEEYLYNGLHFWGYVPTEMLVEWGIKNTLVTSEADKYKLWDVECILVNNEVIRCRLNDDPLNRRPYYKASYQNIPGSFWGRSLPDLMRDIQRMCNGTARELSNNMALSAGPMCEVYIDRLAEGGPLENIIAPRSFIQAYSDPQSGQGRALQWFTVPSVAAELIAVYEKFEAKADDATGIPRYSYGNERVGGAAQTASGLSMLLESATKSIKDAIRHIDIGLIKPRVEYQFYWNIKKNKIQYTGDIDVITHGSEALTMKGTQQMKRQEFLQITANEIDQAIMGEEGRAELIRELAKDLNLTTRIVPSRLELRQRKKERDQKEAQAMQMQQQEQQKKQEQGIAIAQIQGQVADQINQRNTEVEVFKEQNKAQQHQDKMALGVQQLQASTNNATTKALADVTKNESSLDAQKEMQNQKLAFNAVMSRGEEEKTNG